MNNIILKTDISHGVAYKEHVSVRISKTSATDCSFPIGVEVLPTKVTLYNYNFCLCMFLSA